MKKFCISLLLIVSAVLALGQWQSREADYKYKPPAADKITETPKPANDEVEEDKAQKLLSEMSLYEKICQMFIVTPESITGYQTVTKAGDVMKAAIEKYPVGGVIYFDGNIESREQLKKMIKNTQKYSDFPMFISVDQEGGRVARLKENAGFTVFQSMYSYRDAGTDTAYKNAETIGSELKELGFNLDFAPVADVWSNSQNTVIGDRAYSDDFGQAAKLLPYAVRGFHDAGIMCSLKHFPGHGDTYADSHSGNAYVTKSKEELDKEEMLPFKAGISAGADMVMVGHLMVKAIDENVPASLSSKVINDYLREEIGYDGVVITDSLAMGAVANLYTNADRALMAVKAGIDILLMPSDAAGAIGAIENAVNSGEIKQERINDSVRRILALKEKYGLI